MLSLQQLTNPLKRSDVANWLIATLTQLGFQTTGWQPGRIQQQMLNAVGTVGAALSSVAASIAEASYSETATGAALRLYSRSRFDNEGDDAQAAVGPMLLTSTATVPYTIQVGQLIVSDDSGTQFGNITGGTLTAGGTLSLNFEALLAGSDGNIGNSSTLRLVTALSGVTVTNPGPGSGVAWYTVQAGRDQSLDAELRQLNATKWGLLAIEKTTTALIHLALKQDGVAKATVIDTNPRGPGTADVYISGADSLVSTTQIEDAQAAFAYYTMGTESAWPPTDTPLPSAIRLYHPGLLELLLQGTVYYSAQFDESDIEEDLGRRLTAFTQLVPIGGKTYATGVENVVTLGDIIEVIERTRGVLSVTLTNPSGNIIVPTTTLLVPPSDWFGAGALMLVPGIS